MRVKDLTARWNLHEDLDLALPVPIYHLACYEGLAYQIELPLAIMWICRLVGSRSDDVQ